MHPSQLKRIKIASHLILCYEEQVVVLVNTFSPMPLQVTAGLVTKFTGRVVKVIIRKVEEGLGLSSCFEGILLTCGQNVSFQYLILTFKLSD